MANVVENAIIRMLRPNNNRHGKRFYASFLMNAKRIYNDKRVATAAVSLKDKVELYVNLEFFEGLSLIQQEEVLEHECKHLTNLHAEIAKTIPNVDYKILNIAADAAINGPLTSLHEFGVTPAKLNEDLKEFLDAPLIEDGSSVYYYQHLMRAREKVLEKYGDSFDEHGLWEEGDGTTDIIKKSALAKALENAKKECGIGNTPGEIILLLEKLYASTVDWKRKLKMFSARIKSPRKEPTRSKRNRRYGTLVPGKRKKIEPVLAIAVDTSGSISDDYLKQFFGEIDKGLYPNVKKLHIIEADCEIGAVYEYTKGKDIKVTGRGGTAYNPAIEKAKELGVDGLIYFGDGDCFDEVVGKPKFPVMWAMTEGRNPPVDWGMKCEVKLATDN